MTTPAFVSSPARSTRRNDGLRLLAFVLLMALPLDVGAQSIVAMHFLLGGGVASLTGSNPDQLRTGYQIQAAVEASAPGVPVSLRAEGSFDRFGFTLPCASPGCPPVEGNERMIAGTLNAIVQPVASGLEVVPYLIAGAGLYNHDNSASTASASTDYGVNGGVGVRVPGLHVFVEGRMHVVKNAPNYIPIVVGIRF